MHEWRGPAFLPVMHPITSTLPASLAALHGRPPSIPAWHPWRSALAGGAHRAARSCLPVCRAARNRRRLPLPEVLVLRHHPLPRALCCFTSQCPARPICCP